VNTWTDRLALGRNSAGTSHPWTQHLTTWSFVGLLTCLLLACDDGGGTGEDGTDTGATDTNMPSDIPIDAPVDATGDLAIEDLVIVTNPSNVLSFFVEWKTGEPAAATLSVDCGPDYQTTVETGTDSPLTSHSTFIQGLFDGASCNLRVDATSDSGATGTASTTLDVGPLPDVLPELDVTVLDEGAMEPGWTLTNLNNHFEGVPLTGAIIDPQGRYRWYHVLSTEFAGTDNELRLMRDGTGVLFCGTRKQIQPAIVSWEGSTLWTEQVHMHHDCRFVDDDLQVLRYITDSADGCPEMNPAANIVEYNPWTGEELWRWRLCDHWVPDVLTWRWSHPNTIEGFPDENAFLLSLRDQHTLVKVNRDTEQIEWKLGLKGEIPLSDADQFWRQHAPEIQPDGNIVLFDNGSAEERPYSRLIEIAYDETAMTAEVVWEYAPEPRIFAPIWGDADRLANGNTLGTFGLRESDKITHLIEVDADGNEVWHVETPLGWGAYRADRVTDVPLGFALAE